MNLPPLWVRELADDFWREVGGPEPFPRQLREAITWAPLDLSIEALAGLTPARIQNRLDQREIPISLDISERSLRGCLVGRPVGAILFVDADDPADEQRFTLAHELAHFLREVHQRRQWALSILGAESLAVIEGQIAPTPEQRLRALLSGVTLACQCHFLEREAEVRDPVVAQAEADADRLAFELLAPAEEACLHRERLAEVFGLPSGQAAKYLRLLFPVVEPDPLVERLRRSAMNPK